MVISCIGDSLTEGDYGVFGKRGIANVHEKNYPYFLQKILGGEVRNFGKCGYTASTFLERYAENNVRVEGSDIILIMLGTNGGLEPENPTAKGNADYAALVALCKKNAPNAKVVLCTPPHATENPEFSNCGYQPSVSAAVKFVRDFAKREGHVLIDVANCPEFTAKNEEIMQPNDGLHFGEVGYYTLAKYIAEKLKDVMENA